MHHHSSVPPNPTALRPSEEALLLRAIEAFEDVQGPKKVQRVAGNHAPLRVGSPSYKSTRLNTIVTKPSFLMHARNLDFKLDAHVFFRVLPASGGGGTAFYACRIDCNQLFVCYLDHCFIRLICPPKRYVACDRLGRKFSEVLYSNFFWRAKFVTLNQEMWSPALQVATTQLYFIGVSILIWTPSLLPRKMARGMVIEYQVHFCKSTKKVRALEKWMIFGPGDYVPPVEVETTQSLSGSEVSIFFRKNKWQVSAEKDRRFSFVSLFDPSTILSEP